MALACHPRMSSGPALFTCTRVGLLRENPNALRSLLTLAGWCPAPVSASIASSSSAGDTCAVCSPHTIVQGARRGTFGGRPGRGRSRRAARPPSRYRSVHASTRSTERPGMSATASRIMPLSSTRRTASFLRASLAPLPRSASRSSSRLWLPMPRAEAW